MSKKHVAEGRWVEENMDSKAAQEQWEMQELYLSNRG